MCLRHGKDDNMKVYQVIYTSVQHSLSDTELGLSNQGGLRVYSCSQGLSRENLDEIIRVASYRLPKDNTIEYSKNVGDPSVPGLFPKTFRTLRLADGKLAAVQSVYSGVDYLGHEGNFFSHALIFEGAEDDFLPELYYGCDKFKTYLTPEETQREIVHYLPAADDAKPKEGMEDKVCAFIGEHKRELSYILNNAISLIASKKAIKNICISTSSEEETAMYLIALKYLLPRDMEENMGISTYNVYLPSEKQDKIIFHGTISGKNNITKQAIETRESCMFMDMEKLDMSAYEISPLLVKWEPKELRSEYALLGIRSVEGLLDWENTYENVTSPGMGAKLIRLKESGGGRAFVRRARQLYSLIGDDEYKDVRFEISKVMYDNIDMFPDEVNSLTDMHMSQIVEKLSAGQSFDLGSIFSSTEHENVQIAEMKRHIGAIMTELARRESRLDDKTKYIFLGLFAQLKHKYGDESWRDFFSGNRIHLTTFV